MHVSPPHLPPGPTEPMRVYGAGMFFAWVFHNRKKWEEQEGPFWMKLK